MYANRIFVNSTIFDNFVSIFQRSRLLKLSGFDEQIGPLINYAAANRYENLISDLKLSGAKFLHHKEGGNEGLILSPQWLSRPNRCKGFNDEIFGPLVVIYKFETDAEAIRQSNATNYGLASYLFTESRQAIKNYTNLLDLVLYVLMQGRSQTRLLHLAALRNRE